MNRPIFHWRLNNVTAMVLLTLEFVAIVSLTMYWILLRQQSKPTYYIQDGGYQTEVATQKLLAGQNPYTVTYSELTYANFVDPYTGEQRPYPGLTHVVYLPATFLLSIPPHVITRHFFGWYDQRITHLLALVVSLMLLISLMQAPIKKLLVGSLFLWNPLWYQLQIRGHNDIVVFTLLLGVFVALHRRRWLLGGICLGLAVATKQSAWLAPPLIAGYLWWSKAGWRAIWLTLGSAAIIATAIILPFVIWNTHAFLEDTILDSTGNLATSWPVWGMGFGKYLLQHRVIHSMFDYYPFWIWELALGLPTLFFTLRWLRKSPTLITMIIGIAIFTFVMLFFSRTFASNYLGYISLLGIAAIGGKQNQLL